jgi:PAS domain S-box-containing protein
MKNNRGKRGGGYDPFSATWRGIAQTRYFLCACVFAFGLYISNKAPIVVCALVYAALLTLMGFVDARTLQLKKTRFAPAFTDIIFISLIILYSGGVESSWYLFYLFPIISVSRYLGYLGSLVIAFEATISYLLLYAAESSGQALLPSLLALRCGTFVGIAFIAGNLAVNRRRDEERLVKTFERIDQAMLSNMAAPKVFELILKEGLALTSSEMGHIRLIDGKTQEAVVIAAVGQPKEQDWGLRPLDDGISQKVINSKESLIIPSIGRYHLVKYLGTYFRLYKPRPRSALFVPIKLRGKVKGVIAVYSRHRFHYTGRERSRVESLNTLIAMAQKNTDLLREQQELVREKLERLELLYQIGEQLKGESALDDLFDKVVELIYDKINPEEAALFVVGDDDTGMINKVAVKGPTEGVTQQLAAIEKSYAVGESLVGKIFEKRRHEHLSDVESVEPKVEYVDEYRELLPSRRIRHYIGVPLLRGEEILGVIRVINKRGAGYSHEQGEFELSESGFDNDDLQVMQTIASQVAVSIQNAKLLEKYDEAKKYYENLVLNSPDPIIVLDEKVNIKAFNRACEKVWGYTEEEVKGRPVEDYCESPQQVSDIKRELLAARRDGYRIRNHPAKIRHRDGTTIIPISLSASLLRSGDKKLISTVGVFKDLRELLMLKERIVESEKMADFERVVRTVGHDIKHRLGVILSNVKVLMLQCDREGERERYDMYTDIADSALYSKDTIQYMLMAAKPRPPEKRVSYAEEIFRESKERMRRRANSARVEFSISLPDEGDDIFVDLDQMRQVFWNLYNNSLDSIAERRGLDPTFGVGHVGVSARVRRGSLDIFWRDDGLGIRDEDLPYIFDAYYTRKKGGSGLGLFISKSIVDIHDGQIFAESKYGEGTCFTIRLPLWKGDGDEE